MSYPAIPNPREQTLAIMDIFFSHDLDSESIKCLNRCRGGMKAIFLLDISTADGKYLEHFIFDPKRETYQGQLGYLDRFLAQLYNHRRQIDNTSGKLEKCNASSMEMVLQGRGQ